MSASKVKGALYFALALSVLSVWVHGAETCPVPAPLPCGHDYFNVRDGLDHCRLKFERDAKGRVVFMGGSITAMGTWCRAVERDLKARFPKTSFEFINVGYPSLGSTPHTFRFQRDVAAKGPMDLFFIEAAVNDEVNGMTPLEMLRGMEGVVRQARLANPEVDIVMLHFADDAKMKVIAQGKTPVVIEQHEKVAEHYGVASIDLAREVTERIRAGQFSWKDDFGGLHPAAFGHSIYARAIARLFDAAWREPLPADDKVVARVPPEGALDEKSYFHARLVPLEAATLVEGWTLVPNWRPRDPPGRKIGTYTGFVNVPALVAETSGATLKLKFDGTAVGVFVAAGPDAGTLEYSVDGGDFRSRNLAVGYTGLYHLPVAFVLDADLVPGPHEVVLRVSAKPNPTSKGTAARIMHFLVNGREHPSLTEAGGGETCDALAFGDPSYTSAFPEWAVGRVSRDPALDVRPGFELPPAGFGVVPFFWWLGDPLTRERLGWILEQMEGMGISGYQINYAHGYKDGGRSFGLTMPSEPPLFSEDWWKLVGWFMRQAKRQNAAVSLSDYTLGIGQGWMMDAILREHPEMHGSALQMVSGKQGKSLFMGEVPGADGKPRTVSVVVTGVPTSIDPMHPQSGSLYVKKFFGQFEDHFGEVGGKGMNFFFSDELVFGVRGHLWNERFATEFKARKGYDIVPELPALFTDIGPRTPKVRLDYSDVQVALTEEGFFKPVFDWHQQRGMTMGCDHGGRGRGVVLFGDYFRTQRWNQGPGADQPGLGKDLIKAKVAASIAHLYQRPRVWLEGYYATGWGTTSAGVVDATLANFVMGFNLLSLHGMYYSTHGGWWEWAPPDNTFRMPYWKHMRGFMACVQRLGYLLSQGHHRCDVAILYPVEPVQAGMDGETAVKTAFAMGTELYAQGCDFDFMDFQSLARAQVVDRELRVSGERYRVLVLPAMKAVRHSTLVKAAEFRRAGGIVIAAGALPEASDRLGREDPEVAALVKELFPGGAVTNGVAAVLAALPTRDYTGPGCVQHRKLGPRDLYAVYGAPQDTEVTFRASGKVELWDPWTGAIRPLAVSAQSADTTALRLPLTEKEIQLIVFSSGTAEIAVREHAQTNQTILALDGDWEFELQPTSDNRFGDFHWPPTSGLIGAEARQLYYCEGAETNGPWRKVTCSFGPRFIRCEGVPTEMGVSPQKGQTLEFSWRWGMENDAGQQGWWGLAEKVHDEFIVIGSMDQKFGRQEWVPAKDDLYLWTTVVAPRAMTGFPQAGAIPPAQIWVNGVDVIGPSFSLKAGPNPLLLRFDGAKPGRTYFVVASEELSPRAPAAGPLPPGQQPKFVSSPLASRWWRHPAVLPFDVRPREGSPIGWYRFVSPPGLRGMSLATGGKVQAWADGQPMAARSAGRFRVVRPSAEPVTVLLKIEQERGSYGGAAFTEPIRLECGAGSFAAGDWSKNDGLASYSGGAWYRKTVTLPAARRVLLDLGRVAASAEVRVNGKEAGVRVASPWTLDISSLAKPGENRIEILVCNTLANHYSTVPTRFRGSPLSGLLGPVRVMIERQDADK